MNRYFVVFETKYATINRRFSRELEYEPITGLAHIRAIEDQCSKEIGEDVLLLSWQRFEKPE